MSDYTELAKALREQSGPKCTEPICSKECDQYKECGTRIIQDAAAAIEALEDEVKQKNRDIAVLRKCYQIADEAVDKALEPKRGEKVEVVRCKDCVYYHKAHVKLDDGTELDYDSDVVKEYQQKRKESGDPFWEMVCVDLGINVGGRCERDNNQGYAEDKAVFRSETDFCSKARAKMEVRG